MTTFLFQEGWLFLLVNLLLLPAGCLSACTDGFSSVPTSLERNRAGVHYIVPELSFDCDGDVSEWTLGMSLSEEDNPTIAMQIWRGVGTSSGTVTSYTLVTAETYISSYDDDGTRTRKVFTPTAVMPVSSGDVVGFSVNTHRMRLLMEENDKHSSFTIFRRTSGSNRDSTANVKDDYESSSSVSPYISVSFIPSPTLPIPSTSSAPTGVSSASEAASSSQPPESSSQPPESSSQPPESSSQPPESSSQPPESSSQPPESSSQPPKSSSQPPESSSQPPESSSQPPESSSQPPESSSQPPESSSQPPKSSSQPPKSSSQPLKSSSQPPESSSQQAESSSQPPESSSQPPKSSSQPPKSSSQPPESSSQQAESSSQPPESSSQPAESSSQPAESSSQPAESSSQQAESSSQPAESSSQQAESSSQPAESSSQQAESSSQQAESSSLPTKSSSLLSDPGSSSIVGVLDAFPVGGVNSNPVVIGGAVGGVLLLLVLSVVLVVCLVAAIRMRLNKKDSYYAEFARYTRDSDQLDVIRTRRGRAAMPVTNVRYIQNGNATVNSLQPLLFSNSGNFESTVEHTGTDSAYEEIPANSSEAMYEGILEHTDSTGTTWSNTSTTNEIDPQEYSYPLSANDYEGIVRQSDGAGQVWCNQGAMEAMHIYEGLDQYQTMDDSNEEPLSLEQIYTFVPSNTLRSQSPSDWQTSGMYAEMEPILLGQETDAAYNKPFKAPPSQLSALYDELSERKCLEIPRNALRRGTVLGTGHFGAVVKGVWENPYGSKEVAIKLLKPNAEENDKVAFLQEAAVLSQFRHAHIVKCLGAVTLKEPVMIVMEFLQNGDLLSYLEKKKPEPGTFCDSTLSKTLLKFCRNIADGMKYLSEKGFIHRDLATRNILLDKDVKCKIADFGMSKNIDSEYYISKGGVIPVKWTAPEALLYKKYSPASDVWSYGMLMFEIWSLGEKPFPRLSPKETVQKLLKEPHYVQPPPPGCPREIYRLMIQCWNPNHHERPQFSELLEQLTSSEESLLEITAEGLETEAQRSKATRLGSPLQFGNLLYLDLQRYYYPN